MNAGSEDIRRDWNGPAWDVVEPRASVVATSHEQPTLVLGGTGKTGRRVAERLVARGLPVRLGSRSGEPPFDWEDRATWAPALSGAGSVYLTYYTAIRGGGGGGKKKKKKKRRLCCRVRLRIAPRLDRAARDRAPRPRQAVRRGAPSTWSASADPVVSPRAARPSTASRRSLWVATSGWSACSRRARPWAPAARTGPGRAGRGRPPASAEEIRPGRGPRVLPPVGPQEARHHARRPGDEPGHRRRAADDHAGRLRRPGETPTSTSVRSASSRGAAGPGVHRRRRARPGGRAGSGRATSSRPSTASRVDGLGRGPASMRATGGRGRPGGRGARRRAGRPRRHPARSPSGPSTTPTTSRCSAPDGKLITEQVGFLGVTPAHGARRAAGRSRAGIIGDAFVRTVGVVVKLPGRMVDVVQAAFGTASATRTADRPRRRGPDHRRDRLDATVE